jgi:carbamoyltransferase
MLQRRIGGSAFRGEPVLVLTADGAGDDLCATVSTADAAGRLTRLASVPESDSPAMIYLTITTLLGMVPNEHEYKLMGMAPYAPPAAAEEVAAIFEGMFEWNPANPLAWRRRRGVPNTYYIYNYLKKRLDLRRFDIICAGLQTWGRAAAGGVGAARGADDGG